MQPSNVTCTCVSPMYSRYIEVCASDKRTPCMQRRCPLECTSPPPGNNSKSLVINPSALSPPFELSPSPPSLSLSPSLCLFPPSLHLLFSARSRISRVIDTLLRKIGSISHVRKLLPRLKALAEFNYLYLLSISREFVRFHRGVRE